MLQLMFLTFKYVWEILEYDHGFKKASEQCCPVMLFIMTICLRWFKLMVLGGWGGGELHFYKNRWRSSTVLH